MKGIIAAGGRGTRLHPITVTVPKQLLPVYDKPMIYYPLTTLMLAGIREILIVSSSDCLASFERLLGDGSRWGLRLAYAQQAEPKGVGDVMVVAEEFLGGSAAALILGDNIFYGDSLPALLRRNVENCEGATIFCYQVADARGFGVVEFDSEGRPVSLEEKPLHPKSHWAVTGLYFYTAGVVSQAKSLAASTRGELEVTDLNRLYLERGRLHVQRMGRGFTWLDLGTPEALLEGAEFVRALENRQGLKIACPEEVALRMGYIGEDQFARYAAQMEPSHYADYLHRIAKEYRR